jgi:hypothetical protein
MRMQQRNINATMLLNAVDSFEIVESYPHDKYLPSYLVRLELPRLILHAHIAADVVGDTGKGRDRLSPR